MMGAATIAYEDMLTHLADMTAQNAAFSSGIADDLERGVTFGHEDLIAGLSGEHSPALLLRCARAEEESAEVHRRLRDLAIRFNAKRFSIEG